MNKMIVKLKEDLEKETKALKEQQYIVKTIEDNLNDEIYKETKLLDKVLENNPIKIIEMIQKEKKLKLSSVTMKTSIGTIYMVKDFYYANILAKDGKITTDYTGIHNETNKYIEESAENLIYSLNLFADKEKSKYEDKI